MRKCAESIKFAIDFSTFPCGLLRACISTYVGMGESNLANLIWTVIFNLRFERYLRSQIVLGIDTVVSGLASACVLMFSILFARGPVEYEPHFASVWLGSAVVASVMAFYITRTHKLVIRYSTLREFTYQTVAVLLKEVLLGTSLAMFMTDLPVSTVLTFLSLDFLVTMSALLLVRVAMLIIYKYVVQRGEGASRKRVMIYGTGRKAASLVTQLHDSPDFEVAGFLTPGIEDSDKLFFGKKVYYFNDPGYISYVHHKLNLDGIIFAHVKDARTERSRVVATAQELGLALYVAPSINQLQDTALMASSIRKIKIEDLLGREEIDIPMDVIAGNFAGKTVLVTGAAGSIGSELCRQLAKMDIKKLVMLDNAETPLHNVRLEFEDRYPELDFEPVIGDVRQEERLEYVFSHYKPEVVFHAAAYKHVPLMEENPCEAVLVNVGGSRNVADMCVKHDVERMVMVSTDKAVNPTNIMGATKRLAEIYVQSLGMAIERGAVKGKTRFVTTRFGNVLGSNGSVIPRFKEQIEHGGPVTVTHPEIRRFFMTIPEACRLVLEAATMAKSTEIYVFDMGQPIRIAELAERMISLAGYTPGVEIKIEYTGLRPGEKLYEEVLATKENTLPTPHERIFVAKVRDYDYATACELAVQLTVMARAVEVLPMVKLMKEVVPEFKSKHSVFEALDK